LNSGVDELAGGIRRVTLPLPMELDHVHCYLLPGTDGWTLVDTGFGAPGPSDHWRDLLAELREPVARIVITHFHPDHVGGARDAADATGAPVFQGALDYEQCERVWGSDWGARLDRWFALHGAPPDVAEDLRGTGEAIRPFVRYVRDPELLHAADTVDGWLVGEFPGHADGHICLLADGVLIAGDHLLPKISPTVGLYPDARRDPLGDYLTSLERTIELAPRLAFPGHGDPIDDPVGRAEELLDHHRRRLDETEALLAAKPRAGYELSLALFPDADRAIQRRFAFAETLSHLERLVLEGRAARADVGGTLSYTAA
jgi:glyoxylase-like metal-dependent hydrolase (beta-lactamase superfamily II)